MPTADFHLPLNAPQSCPLCGVPLHVNGRARLDCTGCGKTLVISESQAYKVARVILIYGLGAVWAWRRGWDPTFIIFVVSFYVLPIRIVWAIIERQIRMAYPPKCLEPARPVFQTLGL